MNRRMRCLESISFVAFAMAMMVNVALLKAQTPTGEPLDALLLAHHAWKDAPESIRITGTVVHGKVRDPITITATRQEEVLIEYGTKRQVATLSAHFQEDGARYAPQPTPSGFAQLDATGVFFLVHLAKRPVKVSLPEAATIQGKPGTRVRVSGGRSEIHYRQFTVNDDVEVYVAGTGLLAGLVRTFYESMPQYKFTMALSFSDYRDTNGVLLPYHIERYVKGHNVETINVDAYAINVPADPALFMPRRVQ